MGWYAFVCQMVGAFVIGLALGSSAARAIIAAFEWAEDAHYRRSERVRRRLREIAERPYA